MFHEARSRRISNQQGRAAFAVALIVSSIAMAMVPDGVSGQDPGPAARVDSLVAAALALDFAAFDQDHDGGWRALEAQGEYELAAFVLDRYRTERPNLAEWQETLLAFHAGQMYAFAGDTEAALVAFGEAQFSDAVGPGWEPYVRATMLFLVGDRSGLAEALQDLRRVPQVDGPDPNIRVVVALLNNVGRPYAEVYSSLPPP